jgi:hypothetical protein
LLATTLCIVVLIIGLAFWAIQETPNSNENLKVESSQEVEKQIIKEVEKINHSEKEYPQTTAQVNWRILENKLYKPAVVRLQNQSLAYIKNFRIKSVNESEINYSFEMEGKVIEGTSPIDKRKQSFAIEHLGEVIIYGSQILKSCHSSWNLKPSS